MSSSISTSVEDYVAKQPSLVWRRNLMRGFIRLIGFKVLWDVTVTGAENVPPSGPTVLMMNHISLIDPVVFMGAVTSRYVIPMTKIENVRSPLLGPLIAFWGSFPINRGEVDRKALMNSIELIRSGQLVLIAPEGTRRPDGLHEAKDGLAYIAAKADAMILPSGISGAADWKKRLSRLQRCHIRVNFGRPFKFRADSRSRIPREDLSAMTQEAMYQLAMAISDESLRGKYSDLSKASTHFLEF